MSWYIMCKSYENNDHSLSCLKLLKGFENYRLNELFKGIFYNYIF
jgi:hypothetical protein